MFEPELTNAFYYQIMMNDNNLNNADLALFIKECYRKIDDENKIKKVNSKNAVKTADRLISMMMNLLEEYKGLSTRSNPEKTMLTRWFAILVTAAYLYVLCPSANKKYTALFFARENFEELANKHKIEKGQQEALFQTLESSLGFNGPLKVKPTSDSPGEIFCMAIMLNNLGGRLYENKIEKEQKVLTEKKN